MLSVAQIKDPPAYVEQGTLALLACASMLVPPGDGGTAIVRDTSGAYYVGTDYLARPFSLSIRLIGTGAVRTFAKADVFSSSPTVPHTLAEARLIAARQRRGEPALTVPLTEKERLARKRWDLENGRRS